MLTSSLSSTIHDVVYICTESADSVLKESLDAHCYMETTLEIIMFADDVNCGTILVNESVELSGSMFEAKNNIMGQRNLGMSSQRS